MFRILIKCLYIENISFTGLKPFILVQKHWIHWFFFKFFFFNNYYLLLVEWKKKSFLTGNWFFVSCKNWRKYLPKKGSILLKLTLWHVNHSWFMLWSSCTWSKKLVDSFLFFKNWHDKKYRNLDQIVLRTMKTSNFDPKKENIRFQGPNC